MTRLVDGLERDGLVKREPDLDDRRGVIVRATPKGVRTLTRGRARRVEVLAEQLRTLPRQDLSTLATAADLLERVARRD
jgi:DNA-binding MarR family transcriptional regulator